MSEHEAIKLMLNEIVCINTADHNECERDCAKCSLVKETDELLEAYNIAIQALEKQVEKVPTYEGDGYYNGELIYDTWICPCCGKDYKLDYEDYDYCPKCGQHIDHSRLTEDD